LEAQNGAVKGLISDQWSQIHITNEEQDPDPFQSEKSNPDPHQFEKWDPNPHHNRADN
jgi:hypothetical protein